MFGGADCRRLSLSARLRLNISVWRQPVRNYYMFGSCLRVSALNSLVPSRCLRTIKVALLWQLMLLTTNRTKHIDVRYHFIRQCVQRSQVKVIWIPTLDMVADILTKFSCSASQHYALVVKMMGGRYSLQRTQQSALIGGVLEAMAVFSVVRCI